MDDGLNYKVKFLESERGWGQSYESMYYASEEEAIDAYAKHQPRAGPIPDYYIIAVDVLKRENDEWVSIVQYFNTDN